jgi:hypothetical protein
MIAGLVVYALNFFAGKSKNNKLANVWLTSHRTLLEENFSLVGMLPLVLNKLGLLTSLQLGLHIVSASFRHVYKITKSDLLLSSLFYRSVCLTACSNLAPTGWLFMKFDIECSLKMC